MSNLFSILPDEVLYKICKYTYGRDCSARITPTGLAYVTGLSKTLDNRLRSFLHSVKLHLPFDALFPEESQDMHNLGTSASDIVRNIIRTQLAEVLPKFSAVKELTVLFSSGWQITATEMDFFYVSHVIQDAFIQDFPPAIAKRLQAIHFMGGSGVNTNVFEEFVIEILRKIQFPNLRDLKFSPLADLFFLRDHLPSYDAGYDWSYNLMHEIANSQALKRKTTNNKPYILMNADFPNFYNTHRESLDMFGYYSYDLNVSMSGLLPPTYLDQLKRIHFIIRNTQIAGTHFNGHKVFPFKSQDKSTDLTGPGAYSDFLLRLLPHDFVDLIMSHPAETSLKFIVVHAACIVNHQDPEDVDSIYAQLRYRYGPVFEAKVREQVTVLQPRDLAFYEKMKIFSIPTFTLGGIDLGVVAIRNLDEITFSMGSRKRALAAFKTLQTLFTGDNKKTVEIESL